jgi:AcrR family transcriptional regulator
LIIFSLTKTPRKPARARLDLPPKTCYDKEKNYAKGAAMEKPLTTRKRQALEMRSRIQYVALDLFDRDGFENVSVEQIAQAAGCSVGNIYHYFKSKDELIIHITSSVDAQYEVLEREYLSDTTVSARSKLLDFVGRALDISSKDPSLYRSFIHGLKYPEQAILRDNETRVYFRVLRELTAACQQEGSISPQRDRQELVAELVALHRGMLFEWRIYEKGFDLVTRGRRMAAALLDGWHQPEN